MSVQYTTEEQIEAMRKELHLARQKAEAMRAHRFLHDLTSVGKLVGHALFYTVVAVLLLVLATILITKSNGKIPSVFGYQMFVVESGSMAPTLQVGTVILSRIPADKSALSEGTIITFHTTDGAIVTHRIIEVLRDDAGQVEYRTKGDNPINSPDPNPVKLENVIAVFVLKIPFT